MHIKINVPPPRAKYTKGYRFPTLKGANKAYTVPLTNVALKEHSCVYTEDEYDNALRKYVDVDKEIQRYWIRVSGVPELEDGWHEIHSEEHSRISKALGKFNLSDSRVHNKIVTEMGATDKLIIKEDLNALFGISIEE